MNGVPLTEVEYRMWSEWVEDEYGLCFGPERRALLRARLEPRRAALGMDSFEQLLFHVKLHPARDEERALLVPHLTNNESYFWREAGSLDVIRTEVLPALRARVPPGGELRVLSAACSTGEEAYTLAILARETDPDGVPRVRVTGMDVDPSALERARAGVYGEHAFRGTEPDFRTRWFEPEGERWKVRPELAAGVAFRPGNLVDPAWARGLPPQHLVLCRNVLIYFGPAGIKRAAESLFHVLAPGGYLFLGHAESLRHVPLPFAFERRSGALFYRRPEAAA
jgi:chemotaxis protein methyltransferase CheR